MEKVSEGGGEKRFAFYGRVSTTDLQSPEESRRWQLSRAGQLIAGHGRVVAEFFDEGQSRTTPWKRRPQATALLETLPNRSRGWDAVVIGEPSRAFAGIEFGLIFPILTHWGVELWVPEVGGRVDPGSEAHELVMGLFSGLSKGERNRIKIRTRSAMEAMAAAGRFTGGKPPYGYLLVDLAEHPNAQKAKEGKRLRGFEEDPDASAVVRRLFADYAAGKGLGRLADELTAEGVPSPSAHDPERYPHRRDSKGAWSRSAIRAILRNPTYLGKQVYGRTRRAEILVDPTDAAQGYETRQRRNGPDVWSFAPEQTHPPIVDPDTYESVQARFEARKGGKGPRELATGRKAYALRGRIICGECGRRLYHTEIHGFRYATCRLSSNEYARKPELVATHPKTSYLREDKLLPAVNGYLASVFDPENVDDTSEALAAQAADDGGQERRSAQADEWRRKLLDAQGREQRYKAALDAGLDAAVGARFLNEAITDQREAEEELGRLDPQEPPTVEEIKGLIAQLGNIRQRLSQADPAVLADVYRDLGLRVTWSPRSPVVTVELSPGKDSGGGGGGI